MFTLLAMIAIVILVICFGSGSEASALYYDIEDSALVDDTLSEGDSLAEMEEPMVNVKVSGAPVNSNSKVFNSSRSTGTPSMSSEEVDKAINRSPDSSIDSLMQAAKEKDPNKNAWAESTFGHLKKGGKI